MNLIFIFIISNEDNTTGFAAEETVETGSSEHILEHLESSEKGKQEKLDKIAETF